MPSLSTRAWPRGIPRLSGTPAAPAEAPAAQTMLDLGSSNQHSTFIGYFCALTDSRQASKRVIDNLRFFVRHGLVDHHAYTYAFVTTAGDLPSDLVLPSWARNSPRVQFDKLNGNVGFDFGNYRAYLTEPCPSGRERCKPVLRQRFQSFSHFILLPDTVRGPFLPSYVPLDRWPDLLTSMVNDEVKLVGTSVNCNSCHSSVAACRYSLHVDGHLLATDRIGALTMMRGWHPTAHKGEADKMEVEGTVEVRGAGYNIAVLQRFWRGHDFRDVLSTQAKCAQVLKYNHERATNATDRLPYYFPVGGVSCKGCAWGVDLAAYEVMFVHHWVSPRFEHGEAAAYSEMDHVLQLMAERVASPSPDAIASTHEAGRDGGSRAAAWLKTSEHGYCGTTDEGGDCQAGSKGSFGLPESAGRSWQAAASHCLRRCESCARCAFITVSLYHSDCSWYESCPSTKGDEEGLLRRELFRSGRVSEK